MSKQDYLFIRRNNQKSHDAPMW